MTKRIVLCFDGTWNSADMAQNVTNVVKFYRSVLGIDTTGLGGGSDIAPKMETVKWYDPGVGTRWGERVAGGVFGYGLSRNIREGYKFLIDSYQPGDEIYIFGFSRGAYTARSLAGLMRNVGLVKQEFAPEPKVDDNQVIVDGYHIYRERDEGPDSPAALKFRAEYCWDEIKIKFIGVWDTVGALGIPISALSGLNEAYAFHDERLSRLIENAFHAVAIDEQRKEYTPTLWNTEPKDGQRMEQAWFVGAHSDVGGGSHKPWFSDVPLRWMFERAKLGEDGLEFDSAMIPGMNDRFWTARISDSFKDMLFGLYGLFERIFGDGRYYRPVKQLAHGDESVHDTASQKIVRDPKYNPKNPGL